VDPFLRDGPIHDPPLLISSRRFVCALMAWLVVPIIYAGTLALAGHGLTVSGVPDDFVGAPLILALAFAACVQMPARLHEPALLAVALIFSAMVLTSSWRTAESGGFVIGGILPFSDAAGYFEDAARLVHGLPFSEFASRRPLYPAALATVLGLTNGHLKWTLEIFAFVVSAAAVAAAIEIAESDGWVAGGAFFSGILLFTRQIIPVTGTETLGLAFGCLAFGWLWRAANSDDQRYAYVGLFLLTVALNARAGAFFALPAILLWGMSFNREQTTLRFALNGSVAIIAGFALNGFLLYAFGVPSAAFSNFALTLYGLVFGGDWTLALRDHPELAQLSSGNQAAALYHLVLVRIAEHPASLLWGALTAWRDFITTAPAFVRNDTVEWVDFARGARASGILPAAQGLLRRLPNYSALNLITMGGVYCATGVLMTVGLVRLYVCRLRRDYALLALAGLGILASVPFAPPWSGGVRIYAATMPFMVALPAIGIAWIMRRVRQRTVNRDPISKLLTPATIGLVALTAGGPLIVAGLSHRQQFAPVDSCTSTYHFIGAWHRDSLIFTGDHKPVQYPTMEDLKRGLGGLALYGATQRALAMLPPGVDLAGAYDYTSGKLRYLAGPADEMAAAATGAPHLVCADPMGPDRRSAIWRVVELRPARDAR
jgi:hypothetical protein